MGGQGSSQSGDSAKSSQGSNAHLTQFFSAVSQPGTDVIGRINFINYFPVAGRPLAERLFTYISPSGSESRKQECSEILSKIITSPSTSAQNSIYTTVFCDANLKHQDVRNLLQSALALFLVNVGVTTGCSDADNRVINTLATVLTAKGTPSSVAGWIDDNCPELFSGMHRCLIGWLRGVETSSSATDVGDAFTGRLLCKAWWWVLQSALPSVFTKTSRRKMTQDLHSATEDSTSDSLWNLLYSSHDHGLSTNRLQHHVFGYRAPTLVLLSCDDGYQYGVALDTEWREGTHSWGGHSCCVIRLTPDFKKLEEGDNMILFNDRSRIIPRGIFIGRNTKKRLLSLREGMEVVEHDLKTASVQTLEVWGCGDSGMVTAQAKQKKMELKDAEKAAKVKLPGQWEDNPDRMLLEWGGVKVNHAEQFARD